MIRVRLNIHAHAPKPGESVIMSKEVELQCLPPVGALIDIFDDWCGLGVTSLLFDIGDKPVWVWLEPLTHLKSRPDEYGAMLAEAKADGWDVSPA